MRPYAKTSHYSRWKRYRSKRRYGQILPWSDVGIDDGGDMSGDPRSPFHKFVVEIVYRLRYLWDDQYSGIIDSRKIFRTFF